MAAAMNTTIVAGDFARAWALETPVKPFNIESYAIGLEKLVQTSLAKLQTQFEASSALNVDELRAKANQRALEKKAVLERTKLEKTKAVGLTPLSDRALQQAEDWSASFNLTALGTSIAPSGSAVGPTPTGGEETKAVSSSGPLKDWDAISTISKSLGGGASGVPVGPPPTSGESEIKPRAEVLSASRVKEPDSLKKQLTKIIAIAAIVFAALAILAAIAAAICFSAGIITAVIPYVITSVTSSGISFSLTLTHYLLRSAIKKEVARK